MRLELRTLTRARNLTVLHVTHDRAEALALADRVAILEDGRIRQIGTPEEVVSRPKSAFVARFLSDANVLRGSIDGTGFRSDDRAVTVSSDVLRTSSRGSGALAVLPSDVELVPPAAATEHAGVVVSSLFGRDASDVVVTCGGVDFRCAVRGLRPAVGEHVGLEIRRALFYPDDPAAERTPVTSAAR